MQACRTADFTNADAGFDLAPTLDLLSGVKLSLFGEKVHETALLIRRLLNFWSGWATRICVRKTQGDCRGVHNKGHSSPRIQRQAAPSSL